MHYLKNEGARPCALRYLLSFRPEGLYYIVRYYLLTYPRHFSRVYTTYPYLSTPPPYDM